MKNLFEQRYLSSLHGFKQRKTRHSHKTHEEIRGCSFLVVWPPAFILIGSLTLALHILERSGSIALVGTPFCCWNCSTLYPPNKHHNSHHKSGKLDRTSVDLHYKINNEFSSSWICFARPLVLVLKLKLHEGW